MAPLAPSMLNLRNRECETRSMFTHVGIVFRDLKSSGEFYRKVLEPIGIRIFEDHTQPDGTGWLVFGTEGSSNFFVVAAGRPSFWSESSAPASSRCTSPFRRRRAMRSTDFTPWGSNAAPSTTAVRG